MKSYTHFTLSERNCLQQFLSEGKGVREIGRLMGRSASSISREIKRNCKNKKRYNCLLYTSTTTCYMPYINAFFQPRKESDRPKVVPDGAVNFAFIGQFAETPRDTIFTTEYSMRTGMESVYTLLGIDRGVPEVWGSKYDVRELLRACYYACLLYTSETHHQHRRKQFQYRQGINNFVSVSVQLHRHLSFKITLLT